MELRTLKLLEHCQKKYKYPFDLGIPIVVRNNSAPRSAEVSFEKFAFQ